MTNNDEIPFEVPHHWQVCQLTSDIDHAADRSARLGFYRLQRGSGEALGGPMLVDIARGDQAVAKIVYEDIPLAYIEHPTEQERAALLKIFKQTAEELNEDERDGGLFDEMQARRRAAAIIRLRLAPLGLRSDWENKSFAHDD